MIFYFFNLCFIGIIYFIIYHSHLPKKLFLVISLSYLFLISSFRDQSMGADYIRYIAAFEAIKYRGSYYMESGYVFLNWFVSRFTDEYFGIAIAVNLFLFLPLYKYLVKYVNSRYWGLCTFIFAAHPYMFIQSTFNAMRQGCATGIVLIGMAILFSKNSEIIKRVLYFFVIIIAAQFHRMSYLMLMVPFVLDFNWNKTKWRIAFVVSVMGNVLNISDILESVIVYLRFRISYLNYEPSLLNTPLYILLILLFSFYLIYHYDDFKISDSKKKKMIDFYLFSLCFLILAVSNDMFYRVYIMIAFCALPCVPVVCEGLTHTYTKVKIKYENRIAELLYVLYYLGFYTGYIALLTINTNSRYIPFRFCFGW